MGDAPGLSQVQQDALFSLLRTVADGELRAEEARCELCRLSEFDAYETFKRLQGPRESQQGWISTRGLCAWLAEQPHRIACLPPEDADATLAPYANQHGELRYDGFLRLTLPKAPANALLKETALTRGPRSPEPSGQPGAWQMAPKALKPMHG